MASKSTNKRQRTAADTLHISSLPIGFIVNVAEYLPKPSRAILAIAFSARSSSWKNENLIHRPSPISTAIVSASRWDVLDFEEVNTELANKLTDDDIYSILKCISAQDVLKRLKLCGCTNIEGHGLNLLRGSVVLEQIDISLAGKHGNPDIGQSKIIQAAIVPVLDSIISSDGCSLKYIQFPQKWTYIGTHNATGELHPIMELRIRFNQYMYRLTSLGLDCSKCNRRMINAQEWLNGWFQNTMICYECLQPICTQCDINERADFCGRCKKKFCKDCVKTTSCITCSVEYCNGCGNTKACDGCRGATCDICLYTCGGCNGTRCNQCVEVYHCEGCSKSRCQDCYYGVECSIKNCEHCELTYCTDCKVDELKKYRVRCPECTGDAVHLLFEEIDKLRKEKRW